MIELAEGNLLESNVEALVNTVNCVGFMGKGIALQFKQAYPENFRAYERACKNGQVQPGRMLVYPTGTMMNPKYIINFPTKRHWKGKSRIEDIRQGLAALAEELRLLGIRSVAVPPLGCGNGGLDWSVVRLIMEKAFESLPEMHVLLYEPRGAPSASSMPVRTAKPKMTLGRALLIKLVQQYLELGYRCTLLEIQKLAYFLQEAGQPLRLKYQAAHYGPYAQNLNNVLERMEGHFIRGYGDKQQPDANIDLLPTAVEEADAFLASPWQQMTQNNLRRVCGLIEGFETPYGMELLSSVHWVARHLEPPALDADAALVKVREWNDRKRALLQPNHLRLAWERLQEEHWLEESTAVGGLAS